MKVSAKKRLPRKPTKYKKGRYVFKPKGKYSSLAELHASPEWKAYIADYKRKHDMLVYQNSI